MLKSNGGMASRDRTISPPGQEDVFVKPGGCIVEFYFVLIRPAKDAARGFVLELFGCRKGVNATGFPSALTSIAI